MTRMTGPDCVVMCNLINTHTHTHTHTYINIYNPVCSEIAAFGYTTDRGRVAYKRRVIHVFFRALLGNDFLGW